MPQPAEGEAAFAAALRDPERPVPDDLERQTSQAQSRRFDVYRNNMMVSLVEALETAFPAVCRLVGADFFKAAARIYIRQQPPRGPVLLLYGETFGDFLESFEPASGVPYLGDVARLEWARLKAYHAADAGSLAIARLASVPERDLEGLRFDLHPSLSLLRSRFPVASLWVASTGAGASARVDMTRGEEVAVLRPGLQVDVRVLPPGGYDFLTQLAAGGTLGAAASVAAQACEGFDLAEHLRGLFQMGAVVSIHSPGFP